MAANRYLQQLVFGFIKRRTDVVGSFAPAGTGAVTDVKGRGFTVARTNVGVFTITLSDTHFGLISTFGGLQLATGDDKFIQWGTYDASAKTITLRIWDISSAAAADVPANANNRISFQLIFTNSSVAN